MIGVVIGDPRRTLANDREERQWLKGMGNFKGFEATRPSIKALKSSEASISALNGGEISRLCRTAENPGVGKCLILQELAGKIALTKKVTKPLQGLSA